MSGKWLNLLATAVMLAVACGVAEAKDVRLTFPARSELTPVQRLNRQGVEAVGRKQYDKAEALFYKAYLYDPADPFTLNNLGYIAELQGQLERALNFYALASQQGGEALIDRSNAKQLEGQPMRAAQGTLKDVPMRTNRMNVEAIELLSQSRNDEADQLLRHALELDPRNPFTLNNFGVAEEATGDYESALKYYDAAAASGSAEPIVLTLKSSWRGKPVSEMAAASAAELRARMQGMDASQEQAEMLTMRGVSAVNKNEWSAAREDFLKAYALAPESAFALNNRGYVAEKDGDLETAEFYYGEARKARDADARIGLATQASAAGKRLGLVALDSGEQVGEKLDAYNEQRRREKRPVELKRRDGTPGEVKPQPPAPGSPDAPAAQPHV